MEEGILRIVEGMNDAIECVDYVFIDSRELEPSGRKNITRVCSNMCTKVKLLEKVSKKNNPVLKPPRAALETGAVGANGTPKGKSSSSLAADDFDLSAATATDAPLFGKIKDEGSVTFRKAKAARLKKIEASITSLRKELMKTVHKRKAEAESRINALFVREHSTQAPLPGTEEAWSNDQANQMSLVKEPKPPLPLPQGGSVRIDGDTFGQLMEVWEFLNTFKRVIQIDELPSITTLYAAVKRLDLEYRHLREATGNDWATDPEASLSELEATRVLDTIGVALTKMLMKEFERMMSVDPLTDSSAGDLRIPVNALTWREIMRCMLVVGIYRDVGYSESDSITVAKGRGFNVNPDRQDSFVLSLARKRIAYQYTVRHEYQESLFGE
jgi:hypothetical protein